MTKSDTKSDTFDDKFAHMKQTRNRTRNQVRRGKSVRGGISIQTFPNSLVLVLASGRFDIVARIFSVPRAFVPYLEKCRALHMAKSPP